jgi:hypothetical protein
MGVIAAHAARCPDHQGKKHPQSRISFGHSTNLPEPEGQQREGYQRDSAPP